MGPLELDGAPGEKQMGPLEQVGPEIKSQWSNEQAGAPEQELFGPLKQVGLLNKEPTGPLWRPWVMGLLEQAGAPDQEPMEPHGTSRGSRSKDNGSLEQGALNQESMGLLRIP